MREIAGVRIVENREVARGTRWLVFEAEDDFPEEYQPGHVVVLYVPNMAGRWIRHPYSVSWAEGRRIGILYRVIPDGRTTPTMAAMTPGETLRIGGRFGEPLVRLVDDAPALVGVTTGTGLGPLRGYALRYAGERPITILAGFRERVDVPFAEEMDALAARHPTFRWVPTLSWPDEAWTGRRGRVVEHLGEVAVPGAHWHVVGNGEMVTDVHAGLLAAGVEPARVTTEQYFNRGMPADVGVVAHVAECLRR